MSERFGMLTVKEYFKKENISFTLCLCDCGNTKEVSLTDLNYSPIKSCGCLSKPLTKKINLSGRRFGKLLVKEKVDNGWLCICDCGNETIKRSRRVLESLQCAECEKKTRNKLAKLDKIPYRFLGSIIYRGKNENIEVNIDIDDLNDLWIQQNRKCALSGRDLLIYGGRRYRSLCTLSVDRIDSNKGYIKGNIQLVDKDLNKMKLDLTMKEFFEMCTDVVNTLKDKV